MPVTISGTTGISTPAVNATGSIQAAGNIIGTGVCPVGVVLPFALATTPSGWLRCDGTIIPDSGPFQDVTDASILQTLRNLLGTTYGATLGTLPNLQGQFIRGLTTNLSTASRDPLSGSRVNLIGSVQTDAFRSHGHNITDPGHIHGTDAYATNISGTQLGYTGNNTRFGQNTGSAATGITINNSGDLETRPVNIALLYCIKY